MAEHKHGSMDIRTHEATFSSFMGFVTRGAVICILVLIFLALTNS